MIFIVDHMELKLRIMTFVFLLNYEKHEVKQHTDDKRRFALSH